jgi:hypothetical protein
MQRRTWVDADTLNTTALVHELYVKLVRGREPDWRDRAHFLAVAAMAMRSILVDHARGRGTAKRGGHRSSVDLAKIDAVVGAVHSLRAKTQSSCWRSTQRSYASASCPSVSPASSSAASLVPVHSGDGRRARHLAGVSEARVGPLAQAWLCRSWVRHPRHDPADG